MLARILACASVAVSPSRPRSRPGGFQTGYVDVFAARLRTALAEVPRRQLRLPWRVDEDVRRPRLPLAGRREATARCLPRNTTRCFARLFATSSRPGERRTIELKRKANPRSHLTRGLISVRPRRRPRSSHQGLEQRHRPNRGDRPAVPLTRRDDRASGEGCPSAVRRHVSAHQPPGRPYARQVADLCPDLLLLPARGASDADYRAIAAALWAESGYAQRARRQPQLFPPPPSLSARCLAGAVTALAYANCRLAIV